MPLSVVLESPEHEFDEDDLDEEVGSDEGELDLDEELELGEDAEFAEEDGELDDDI